MGGSLSNNKRVGYLLRFGAVIIWGLDPILLKYTPLSTIKVTLQMPLLLIGASFFTGATLLFLGRVKIKKNYRLEIDRYFIMIILSTIILILLIILSLKYTSSSNFIILNNFAPVFTLLIALFFWKSSLPYFQKKRDIISMFIIFLLGAVGSLLVLYQDSMINNNSLWGDFLAFLYMIADIIFVTSQIQYIKKINMIQSYFMNFYLYFFSLIILSPLLIYNFELLFRLNFYQILWSLIVGALWGLGTLLTFEAYRRMDGFIGFLMFNISILITIFIEFVILEKIQITTSLIIGTIFIIGASIFAEIINTRSQYLSKNI